MPYNKASELPDNVSKVLPSHAQEIYFKAFNNAWQQYSNPQKRRDNADQEEVAHRVAWAAVKKAYHKGADGKWHPKK